MPDYFLGVLKEFGGKLEGLNANVKWVETVGKEMEIWLQGFVHEWMHWFRCQLAADQIKQKWRSNMKRDGVCTEIPVVSAA